MYRRALILITILLLFDIAVAAAQPGRRPPRRRYSAESMEHKLEITTFGGYGWTMSRSFCFDVGCGNLDVKDSEYWGIAADFIITDESQLELLYTRQDSDLIYKSGGIRRTVSDIAVEYWQIGGLRGYRAGRLFPFGGVTVGATRFDYGLEGADDTWKFSTIFFAGAKIYASERIGLRVQGRFPFTLVSSSGGLACGYAGCYTSVGGTGIAQFDLSAAVMLIL